MLNIKTVVALALILTTMTGCVGVIGDPPATAGQIDLQRYAGLWYEIARYPNNFQRNCTGTTAEYTIRDDGRVGVFNSCFEGSLDGSPNTIEGSARVVEGTGNAQLKVSFFAFFEGDYWILDVGDDDDYGYAVVGSPDRQFLWFLSRTPDLDDELYADLEALVTEQGYDPEQLERTLQPDLSEME